MTDLPPLREVIARYGLAARRALGQHFLLDANLTQRIVRAVGSLAGRHVVEIGPGPGGLTRALLGSDAASVTVVEIDHRAVAAMQDLAALVGSRLRIVAADALEVDLAALVPEPRQVVANLPYNIATPLLIGWLRQATAFERLTLMFQQEVAERICAEPGTPAYGRLSILAQWTCETDLLLRIPPSAFVPPPKVFSAVVGLEPSRDATRAGTVRCDGAPDGSGVRPAAKDAAWRAEAARRGGLAASGGYRGGSAGGNAVAC